MADPIIQLIEHRVDNLEETMRGAIAEIRDGIREIATNTGKLALLEERHAETRDGLARAFAEITKLQDDKKAMEARILDIEVSMPGLKETRGWVVNVMVGIISVVGLALLALVINKGV